MLKNHNPALKHCQHNPNGGTRKMNKTRFNYVCRHIVIYRMIFQGRSGNADNLEAASFPGCVCSCPCCALSTNQHLPPSHVCLFLHVVYIFLCPIGSERTLPQLNYFPFLTIVRSLSYFLLRYTVNLWAVALQL